LWKYYFPKYEIKTNIIYRLLPNYSLMANISLNWNKHLRSAYHNTFLLYSVFTFPFPIWVKWLCPTYRCFSMNSQNQYQHQRTNEYIFFLACSLKYSTYPPYSHHNSQCVFWQEVAAENMLRKWRRASGGGWEGVRACHILLATPSEVQVEHPPHRKCEIFSPASHLNLPSSYVEWNFCAGAYFIGILYEICGQLGILSAIFVLNFSQLFRPRPRFPWKSLN